MDNAQKAIMLGVGLFITIIVIAAVMAITGIGQDLIGQGQSKISGLSGQLAAQIRTEFDDKKLTGTQVRNAIQTYYNDETLAIYLVESMLNSENPISGLTGDDGSAFKLTSGWAGTFAAPYICTASYIDVQGSVEIIPSTVANSMNLKGVNVGNGYFNPSASTRPTLATLTGAVSASGKYKSVLIINQATSEVMGVLFARYQ